MDPRSRYSSPASGRCAGASVAGASERRQPAARGRGPQPQPHSRAQALGTSALRRHRSAGAHRVARQSCTMARVLRNSPLYVDGKVQPTEGQRTIVANAPTEGPFRLIQPVEVAQAVWEAYDSERLHWNVPEEIEQIDKQKAESPEAMRDARIAMDSWL